MNKQTYTRMRAPDKLTISPLSSKSFRNFKIHAVLELEYWTIKRKKTLKPIKPNFFTLTAWKMPKTRAHQRLIFKVKNQ